MKKPKSATKIASSAARAEAARQIRDDATRWTAKGSATPNALYETVPKILSVSGVPIPPISPMKLNAPTEASLKRVPRSLYTLKIQSHECPSWYGSTPITIVPAIAAPHHTHSAIPALNNVHSASGGVKASACGLARMGIGAAPHPRGERK